MTNVQKLLSSAQYRPYTAYNIFFQLEREFILQCILGVSPSVDTVFDSDVDDAIPTLPEKYQDIMLADDWYIPGKAQRKKRIHRKSHGKIGFSDLSKRVATAWHNCDNDVKLFCAEVSDITMQEYKAALRRQQKIEKEEDDSSTEESRTVKRTRRKRVRQPKKEKKVVKKRQPKKEKKVASDVHADTARSSQEVSSKKTDDTMTIEEIISSLTPLCDETQVVGRISNERQTITQESSTERSDLPSVGQLSLPIPSYYHSYPIISTGSSLADVADVADEDIWNMWMSCD